MDRGRGRGQDRGRGRSRARGQQPPATPTESPGAPPSRLPTTPHGRPITPGQMPQPGKQPDEPGSLVRSRGKSRGQVSESQQQQPWQQQQQPWQQQQQPWQQQQQQPRQQQQAWQQQQPRQQQQEQPRQQQQAWQQQQQPRQQQQAWQQQQQPRQQQQAWQQQQPRQQQQEQPRQQLQKGLEPGSPLDATGQGPTPQVTSPWPAVSRAGYRGAERSGNGRQGLQQPSTESLTQAMARVGLEPGAVGGGDNGGKEVGNGRSIGRGVQRGRREISQIVWTKPSTITVKKGGAGQSINVLTNYFNLVKKQNWVLCLYHVDFSPDEDRTRERKQLLRQHQEVLGVNYLFDGMQLYLPIKLGAEVTDLASKRESDESVYTVRLKFIKELSPLDSQYLQLMNIILRRCMDFLGMQVIGRNYFSSKDKVRDERYKIEIWPGVCTSIRHHENSLLLNVDVMHKFLRAETAYDVLRKCGQPNLKAEAAKHLLGSIVMTQYNERTYRVDELDWELSPTSKFSYRGGEITYMEYYEKNYQVKIRDVKQPMIMSKPKKRDLRRGSGFIYLVPELCKMTGLTDDMRADFNMMKDLAQYMRMGPDKRVQALLRYNKNLATNVKAKQEMTHWGLEVSPSLVSVQGRMLPEEQIIVGGQSISFNRRTSDWSRETRSMILNTPVDLKHWAIVYPIKFSDDARELVTHLQRIGKPMGMNLANPSTFVLRADSAHDYVSVLNQCAGMELVMAILPNNRADRYNAFKRHLSIKMGIPSQCILSRTLFKKQRLMSVATKVAIQMNCKLGGEPWSVAIPIKNAMVIGYDAYHDKVARGASYGAVVSSLNQPWTRYLSQVARHFNQEELTDNFALGVKNAVTWYQKENGCYPNMIVVYRDGVGEGQIEYVKEHEIAAIKRCFAEALPKPPRLGFIIVSKRINTRMFLENRGQIENPLPGTVIDDVITLPERYDFFLVSQSINQGTVSPTSFNIIEDTTGLQPDHMQRLAYKLCHTYFNWQGTVRVPAPCMFAHKLAYMTGQTINDRPHQNLVDRLWYL